MTTTNPTADGYLLDNAGSEVPDRWAALSALFDEPTFRRLREVGVGAGWHCLDVGAGGGSVARWLAERVGPSGHVTATDLDTRWLADRAAPNLTVLRHDITRDRLPVHAYHLIHARLVLGHLAEPAAVIDRLIPALRPLGWLVLEEFDPRGYLDGACHQPRTEAEHRANRIRTAFTELLAKRGADLRTGSRIPELLAERGFGEIEIRGSFETGPNVRRLERANLEQVRDELLAHGISADDLDAHLTDLPRLPVLMPVLISTIARKWPS
ncbi:MAG: methyltransferase domain-containing protein [Microlunatus sp.]